MLLKKYSSRFLKTNTYLVACDLTKKAMIIDPGIRSKELEAEVRKNSLHVIAIVNTHTHLDHLLGNHKARTLYGAPVMVHEAEEKRLTRISPAAWITGHSRLSPPADRLLVDGDIIIIGSLEFLVIHTPGHSPGGICLRHKKNIFTGDTLFRGGIGRSDFKGGDYDTLVGSIRDRLFILSDDIFCHPGHGPKTTIEDERKYNIFVKLRPEQIEMLLLGPPKAKKAKSTDSNLSEKSE